MKKMIVGLLGAAALAAAGAVAFAASPEEGAIRKVLVDYQAAMESRKVEKLADVVTDDLLILEGTHKNDGWADYRDKHIGPEMAEWTEFTAADSKISRLEVSGDLAYVIQEATYTIVTAKEPVVLLSAATFVLGKTGKGWKIKHIHMSGKRVGPPKTGATPPVKVKS
ncbi:MAG: nuclear transport factor 2 family protein [Elusimicrobiota bacterium]|nr:MAG: nuclear transport factor 2 family protein [Elusimicrobiota bacterium]